MISTNNQYFTGLVWYAAVQLWILMNNLNKFNVQLRMKNLKNMCLTYF